MQNIRGRFMRALREDGSKWIATTQHGYTMRRKEKHAH
jgi:hypothetical protein